MLDSRPRGRGYELRWRHCVVSLSKTRLSLLSTGSTQEDRPDITENAAWDVKKHTKSKFHFNFFVSASEIQSVQA